MISTAPRPLFPRPRFEQMPKETESWIEPTWMAIVGHEFIPRRLELGEYPTKGIRRMETDHVFLVFAGILRPALPGFFNIEVFIGI